jgi:dolichyl-phosphate beta-glucosyltransferase
METTALILYVGLIILLIVSFVMAVLIKMASDDTLFDRTQLPDENPEKLEYFIESAKSVEKERFASVFDDRSLYVSFVVPAYNEEQRIPKMLDETIEYLEGRARKNQRFTYEIIVVDDGSTDKTAELVKKYSEKNANVLLLRQPHNMGKGAAIQAGCLHARGELVLMIDADGATKIDEFQNLENEIKKLMKNNREAIVVGSRAEADKATRTPIRRFLGWAMHVLIVISGVRGINDTQCGFKLFSREACRWLFMNQHVQRWCFDPELLVIGRKRGMKISEIPVEWNEIEGSKMKFSGMVKMAIDLVKIAIYHRTGLWTIRDRRVQSK